MRRKISDEPYLDCLPTSTLVGSDERIEVYRQRYASREELYHPQDCKMHKSPELNRYVPGPIGLREIWVDDLEAA